MPPQISDDEHSVSSEGGVAVRGSASKPTTLAGRTKSRSQQPEEEEKLMVDSEDNEEDDKEDDDEIGEDEYVVEAITDHAIDEDGNLFFEVKWEGFEKKSDRTMEPEENLAGSASLIIDEYLSKIGGRAALFDAWEEKKAAAKKGKKRGRAETNGTSGAKRGRKEHPASKPLSASARSSEFKPPAGSWEDVVKHIDACEGEEGSVVVYLTWESGHRSQHSLAQVYKRCPQRMLRFYESHLSFKRDKSADEGADYET